MSEPRHAYLCSPLGDAVRSLDRPTPGLPRSQVRNRATHERVQELGLLQRHPRALPVSPLRHHERIRRQNAARADLPVREPPARRVRSPVQAERAVCARPSHRARPAHDNRVMPDGATEGPAVARPPAAARAARAAPPRRACSSPLRRTTAGARLLTEVPGVPAPPAPPLALRSVRRARRRCSEAINYADDIAVHLFRQSKSRGLQCSWNECARPEKLRW